MTDNNDDGDIIESIDGDVPHTVLEPEKVGEDDSIPDTPLGEPLLNSVDITDDDDSVAAAPVLSGGDDKSTPNDVSFPEDMVDFRGEEGETLLKLMRTREDVIGEKLMGERVRTPGSFENLIYRAIVEPSLENDRVQEAIASFSAEERAVFSDRYKVEGKTLLKTASVTRKPAPGVKKKVSGDEAVAAFAFLKTGGGFRIPLYNSGITLDVLTPTGNDIETLLANCLSVDNQLGSGNGAHYFTYNDLLTKTEILNFIQPLIVNSSYVDWKKRNKLWSVIKLPDLTALVATLAALCYSKGFDGFITKCTNPGSGDIPIPCGHTETIKANIFEMIMTRWAAMPEAAIKFMVEARTGNAKHTLTQITQYQEYLGMDGEKIEVGDTIFTMHVPSLADHAKAGSQFLADVINEVQGDNTDGRYEQLGLRYIRTFVPWIQSVEKSGDDENGLFTDEYRVVVRELENIHHFEEEEENSIVDKLRRYINKTQLTYVGYPATACPSCNYVADTPSGMLTFDPFTTFFTLAFRYSIPARSAMVAA